MSEADIEPVIADVCLADEDVTDINQAVEKVLRVALIHDGLVRGLHQVAKVLDAKRAHVVFMAESCNQPAYKKLVTALCKEKDIPCISVPEAKDLGKWAGLCKIDRDGEARKIVGAACVAVTEYGDDSRALEFLRNHIAVTTAKI